MKDENQDLAIMWGTVREFTSTGSLVLELDDGGETLIPSFWAKLWGHDPASLTVGTRLRCAVAIEWKPDYEVQAILTAVHTGTNKRSSHDV